MTNKQARLIGTAIALVGGGVAANAKGLDINVGIAIIVVTFVLFLAEYIRCQMPVVRLRRQLQADHRPSTCQGVHTQLLCHGAGTPIRQQDD